MGLSETGGLAELYRLDFPTQAFDQTDRDQSSLHQRFSTPIDRYGFMIPLLAVKDICKSFLFEGKEVLVLDRISFTIETKEFISIIGPSGCGKSTLLEVIAGITKPDCGSIVKSGADISGKPGFMGYMPQDDLLLPWLSLLENAILPDRIQGKEIKESRQKARDLLPDFGLEGYQNHLPWQLSGGMKQRASFLRAVMSETEILLLDEPFANLDAITRLQMQKWLFSLRTKLSQTIIMVTHDIDEAIRLSDKIYVMDKNPAPFVYEEKVPSLLHNSGEDNAQPLWLELKTKLTSKLLI